jgi:hypothetical protein
MSFILLKNGGDCQMSERINMKDMRFGNLKVMEPTGKNNCGQMKWLCKCDCGEIKVVNGCDLRSGKTSHCGCKRKSIKDLKGQRFGDLLAIKPIGKSKKRLTLWACKCICGRDIIVESTSLISGNTKSCGNCSFGSYETIDDKAIGSFKNGECFIIDKTDLQQVKNHRWWIDYNGYFTTEINGKRYLLHNFLMGLEKSNYVVDHIDRDKKNNSRSNLRICTPKENSRNRSKPTSNSSGFVGVCYHINNHKYYASIKVNGRNIHIGTFDNKIDAAIARDIAAIKYFGEYAFLNFPRQEKIPEGRFA